MTEGAVNIRQALTAGLILGVTAALIVWWLERFELERLHAETRQYLVRYDEFRDWLQAKADGEPT